MLPQPFINTAAIYWQHSYLLFKDRTDREAVFENIPLNLSLEIEHTLEIDFIHQMKDELLLAKFLFSIR